MGTEGFVSLGDISCGRSIEVPVGRRQAVRPMFMRDPAERPERVLEVLGQGREALPSKDNGGVFQPL